MKNKLVPNIQIDGLSIGFRQKGKTPFILKEKLNFSANQGEIVALIGSNGIGKSTLLRTIAGFLEYYSGEIKIKGESIDNFSSKEKAKILSFVSTEIVKTPNLSVFDLVAFGRHPFTNWYGKITEKDREQIEIAIKSVGLEGFESKYINKISDGERQRAMVARTIAQDTPVIILDEPTAFLDVSNKYDIFHLLQSIAHENGKTILLSTHDLNIALREVDKFWIMLENENYEGAPEDTVLNGWFQNIFTNKHIDFDLSEGDFYFKKEFKQKVKVVGEGLPFSWTLRALNRMGYRIVTDADSDSDIIIFVNVQNNIYSWRVKQQKKTTNCFSIYQLLMLLNQTNQ